MQLVTRLLHRAPALLVSVVVLSAPLATAVAQAREAAPAPQAATDTIWHATMSGPIPLIRRITGVRAESGPFREYYQTPAGTAIGAHRHTADMHLRVISGRQFILMGDLETARVQKFDAGSTFVIPAGTWHVEWFEEDTLVEISGVGPMRTERPPATARISAPK